jgi:TRAP-type C4-dicarboxylate transport system substrate-binding protein
MSYERKIVAEGEKTLLDSLRLKGMDINTLSPESLEAFKNLAEPVYSNYAGVIGSDVIERFREATKK